MEKKNHEMAIEVLRGGRKSPPDQLSLWSVRLMLLLGDAYARISKHRSACREYRKGEAMAKALKIDHIRILCLLGEAQCLIARDKHAEAKPLLAECSAAIGQHAGNDKERLLASCLILTVLSLLLTGEVKSAKAPLKELQKLAQSFGGSLAESLPACQFSCHWMAKEVLIVLVYLVSQLYSFLSGSTGKALTYAENGLSLIQEQNGSDPLLLKLKAHIFQYKAMCQLVQGKFTLALDDISRLSHTYKQQDAVSLTQQSSLHLLLGLYASSVDHLEWANAQFLAALKGARDAHLWHLALLNVAFLRLNKGEANETLAMLAEAEKHQIGVSHKVGMNFVKGLANYLYSDKVEDSGNLHDALVKASDWNLPRMTSSSLMLLGQLFLRQGNVENAEKMIFPALELALSLPDVFLQLWCFQLLEMFYAHKRDAVKAREFTQKRLLLMQQLTAERQAAIQRKEHSLIQWIGDSAASSESPAKAQPKRKSETSEKPTPKRARVEHAQKPPGVHPSTMQSSSFSVQSNLARPLIPQPPQPVLDHLLPYHPEHHLQPSSISLQQSQMHYLQRNTDNLLFHPSQYPESQPLSLLQPSYHPSATAGSHPLTHFPLGHHAPAFPVSVPQSMGSVMPLSHYPLHPPAHAVTLPMQLHHVPMPQMNQPAFSYQSGSDVQGLRHQYPGCRF